MIFSRAAPILLVGKNLSKNIVLKPGKKNTLQIQQARWSGDYIYFYRKAIDKPNPHEAKALTIFGSVAWWWFFYNLFTEYEELFGLYGLPDPDKFTDEELGIPPLDKN